MNNKPNKKIIWILCIAFLVLSGFGYLIYQNSMLKTPAFHATDDFEAVLLEEDEIVDNTSSESDARETETDEKESVSTQEQIKVYICGAVCNPGVYEIDQSARLVDLVDLSGGTQKDADLTSVNLAESLEDGQKIYIMTVGETEEQMEAVKEEEDGMVDINAASKEVLMTLPGIGESKAASIISYREENDGFQSIDDIMKIEGIKEGVFNKIKGLIKI